MSEQKYHRLRRMRLSPALRQLKSETRLHASDLIMPIFIHEGAEKAIEIKSMPGIYQLDIDSAMREIEACQKLGFGGVLLFGIPSKKDEIASGAYLQNGIIQQALRMAKQEGFTIPLIADTCQCEYTANGQCGPLDSNGHVHNDETLELLKKTSLSQAQAGADIIAPSTMIDGMITAIRDQLDMNGFENTPILSYSSKFASQFYGPFRDAAGSGDNFEGDRKNHQMDPANGKEAQMELQHDILEGADILMVKPAMTYLDVIFQAKSFGYPVWAYNVSGEYSMVHASAKMGYSDAQLMSLEILTCIKRAGADRIISYHCKEIIDHLT